MCLRYITTAILTRERSEEEKRRRHIHGDKGAKFSGGKIPKIDGGGNPFWTATTKKSSRKGFPSRSRQGFPQAATTL